MASQSATFNLGIKTTADLSGVNELKKSLAEIKAMGNDTGGFAAGFSSQEMSAMLKSVNDIELAMQKAFDVDLNTINVDKFRQSLSQSGTSVLQLRQNLSLAGATGDAAFLKMAGSMMQLSTATKTTNSFIDKMVSSMANTARYQLMNSAWRTITGSISQAYGYVKNLDSSLNDIQIVTEKNADAMKEFAKQANNAAQVLGTSTTDYTDASLIYYQQGLDDNAVADRTNVTMQMANVLGTTASEVSDYMTAIWNNFDDGSKSLEYYGDVITSLGAHTASSAEEIAEGLNKFASVADTVGLSYEYATASLATVVAETRQSADVVGTAFKTLFARIQDLELGDEGSVSIGTYAQALEKVGVEILDEKGNMKDMDTILNDIGAKWNTLSQAQQTALAQNVAGTRQYTQFVALMSNWEEVKDNVELASDATGTLDNKQEIYMQSVKAHLETLNASWEDFYDSMLDTDTINGFLTAFSKIGNFAADFADSVGGLTPILGSLINLVLQKSNVINNTIATAISNSQLMTRSLNNDKEQLEQIQIMFSQEAGWNKFDNTQLETATKETLEYYREMAQYSELMTKEEKEQVNALTQKKALQESNQILLAEEIQNWSTKATSNGLLDNSIMRFDVTNEGILKIRDNLNSVEGCLDRIHEQVQDTEYYGSEVKLEEAFKSLREELESIGVESKQVTILLEKLTKIKIGDINNSSQFENFLKAIKEGHLDIDSFYEEYTKLKDSIQSGKEFSTKAQEIENFSGQLDLAKEKISSGMEIKVNVNSIVKAISTVGNLAMSIQILSNLGSIWNNEDITTGEKLLQTIINLTMAIPMLASSLKTLNTIPQMFNWGQQIEKLAAQNEAIKINAALEMELDKAKAASKVATYTAMNTAAEAYELKEKFRLASHELEILRSAQTEQDAIMRSKLSAEDYVQWKSNVESTILLKIAKLKDLEAASRAKNIEAMEAEKAAGIANTNVSSLNSQVSQSQTLLNKTSQAYGKTFSSITGLISSLPVAVTAALGTIAAVLVAGVVAWKVYRKSLENTAETCEGIAESNLAIAESQKEQTENIRELINAYEDLSNSTDKTAGNLESYRQKVYQLCTQYGEYDSAIKTLTADYEDLDNIMTQISTDSESALKEDYEKYITSAEDALSARIKSNKLDMKATSDAVTFGNETEYAQKLATTLGFNENKFINDVSGKVSIDFNNEEIQQAIIDNWDDFQSFIDAYGKRGGGDVSAEVYQIFSDDLKDTFEGLSEAKEELENTNKIIAENNYKELDNEINEYSDYIKARKELINNYLNEGISEEDAQKYANEFYSQIDNLYLYATKHSIAQALWSLDNPDAKITSEDVEDYEKYINDWSTGAISYLYDNLDLFTPLKDNLSTAKALNKWKNSTIGMSDYSNTKATISNAGTVLGLEEDDFGSSDIQSFIDTTYRDYKETLGKEAKSEEELLTMTYSEAIVEMNKYYQEKEKILANDKDGTLKALEDEKNAYYDLYGGEDIVEQYAQGLKDAKNQINEKLGENYTEDDIINILEGDDEELKTKIEDILKSTNIDLSTIFDSTDDSTITNKIVDKLQNGLKDVDLTQEGYEGWNLISGNYYGANGGEEGSNEIEKGLEDFIEEYDKVNGIYEDLSVSGQAYYDVLQDLYGEEVNINKVINDYKKYEKIVEGYNDITDAIDDVKDGIIDWKQAQKGLENGLKSTNKIINNLQTGYSTIKTAEEEYNKQGFYSIDTLQSIIDLGPEVLQYYVDENGQLNINSQTAMAAMQAQIQLADAEYMGAAAAQFQALAEAELSGEEWKTFISTYTLADAEGSAATASLTLAYDAAYAAAEMYNLQNGGTAATTAVDNYYNAIIAGHNAYMDTLGNINSGNWDKIMSKPSSSSGGSSSSKKKDKKLYEDEFDALYKIKKVISDTSEVMDDLDKKQEHLYGKELANSLREENKLLEQQKKNYEELYAAQTKEMGSTIDKFNEISKTSLNGLEIQVDESTGMILNYAEITTAMLNYYNDYVRNLSGDEQDAAEELYNNMKTYLEDIQSLADDRQDTKNNIEDIYYEELENNFEAWEAEIQVKLDLSEAKREWTQFVREINTDFRLKYTDGAQELSGIKEEADSLVNDINTLGGAMKDIEGEIDSLTSGGGSDMFASVSEAQDTLKEYLEKYEDAAEALYQLYQDVWDEYLDAIDEVADQFQDIIDKFDNIIDTLDYASDYLELMYGEEGSYTYQKQSEIENAKAQNYNAQVASYKEQVAFWEQQYNAEVAANGADSEAAYNIKQHWNDAIADMEDAALNAIEAAQEAYEDSIDAVIASIKEETGLDWASEQWDLYQTDTDGYYDDIERIYQVSTIANKYQELLNKNQNASLAIQNKIKAVMDQQIENLETKDALSERDIELAEKQLAITEAQIALEEAENAKNQMKLTRDSSGNWTYQYVADSDDIAEKEQAVLDANNDFYEAAKEGYEDLIETIIDLPSEAYEKIAEKMKSITAGMSDEQKATIIGQAQEIAATYSDAIAKAKNDLNYMSTLLGNSAMSSLVDLSQYGDIDIFSDGQLDTLDYINSNGGDWSSFLDGSANTWSNFSEQAKNAMEQATEASNTAAAAMIDTWVGSEDYDTGTIDDTGEDSENADGETDDSESSEDGETKKASVQEMILQAIQNMSDAQVTYTDTVTETCETIGEDYTNVDLIIQNCITETNNLKDDTAELCEEATEELALYREALEYVKEAWESVKDAVIDAGETAIDYLEKTNEAAEELLDTLNEIIDALNEIISLENDAGIDVGGGSSGTSSKKTTSSYRGVEVGTKSSSHIGNTNDQEKALSTVTVNNDSSVKGTDASKTVAAKKVAAATAAAIAANNTTTTNYHGLTSTLYKNTLGSFSEGGEIVSTGNSVLDSLAKSIGEDTTVTIRKGERILSNSQTKAFDELVYNLLPNLINSNISSMISGLNNLGKVNLGNTETSSNNNYTIENINAEFPNADDVTTIQEAIMSLPNIVSQYVNQK